MVINIIVGFSIYCIMHSIGNVELLYEAKADKDASACAAKARMTANNINNLGGSNASRHAQKAKFYIIMNS